MLDSTVDHRVYYGMYAFMHACVHACMHACICIYIYIHIYIRTIYISIYIYIYVCLIIHEFIDVSVGARVFVFGLLSCASSRYWVMPFFLSVLSTSLFYLRRSSSIYLFTYSCLHREPVGNMMK